MFNFSLFKLLIFYKSSLNLFNSQAFFKLFSNSFSFLF